MRIIAGKYRGLKLEEFDLKNIRPTLDRAREGIFNKIQFDIPNSKCLDLFGGTGAFSLEFLSRGANEVITCDSNFDSCKLIEKNFSLAKVKPNLKNMDYMDCLNKLKDDKFDIIFIDPPFASDFGLNAIKFIDDSQMLASEGVLIFEHSSDLNLSGSTDIKGLKNLKIIDTKKYGYITVDYLVRV